MGENTEVTETVLKFKKRIRYMVEENYPDYELVSETKHDMTIRLKLPHGRWLNRMLLSYGSDVEVISPESLREEIKSEIQAISNIYS